ncbi:hypothetical protein HBI56_061480 [Parastagonospora nodorum]|uniref:Uncharacterized protein n=1 Tax=Phaeosphaeria nodorum (strain SN15 / ATCC MYA-4574 / FGSC 10173) TaxID=321614 RepID=A0A7U2F2J6_PHANO|nr:hypothetical protein HBH56_157100 [Parastagonospora nodorum]QRC97487.1 hypothetical protein JI435_410640 [Parastagonospora nodorum SN15]KAH3922894.1 hypothetical protein HBH54_217640 [Parastagonospora nodorum]KAH3969512.1 hypothetical protein HBH52_172790 [Parastagonospora nodorum]KAH3973629.1 hypothetical protein HBH51_098020 [Parastagonospora nodorum]
MLVQPVASANWCKGRLGIWPRSCCSDAVIRSAWHSLQPHIFCARGNCYDMLHNVMKQDRIRFSQTIVVLLPRRHLLCRSDHPMIAIRLGNGDPRDEARSWLQGEDSQFGSVKGRVSFCGGSSALASAFGCIGIATS